MFDIKLYDETGERETIRGLSWSQMTTVQSVISRLHFLLGNKQYKHKTSQVSDESEIAALRSELEAVKRERDELKRVETIANTIYGVVSTGSVFRSAKMCPHGNCAIPPYNHPWWCDDCWHELKDALDAAAALKGDKG